MAGEGIKRQNSIIEDLKKGPKTKEYIMNQYDIGEESFKKDIAAIKRILKDSDSKLERIGKGTYVIKNEISCSEKIDQAKIIIPQKSRVTDYNKLILLGLIESNANMDKVALKKEYSKYFLDDEDDELQDKLFENAWNGLEKDGLIKYDGEKLIIDTKKAPIMLPIKYSDAEYWLNRIQAYGNAHSFEEVFENIETKLLELLDYDKVANNTVITGNRLNKNKKLKERLDEFNKYDYDKYALRVSYENSVGEKVDYSFFVGFVCYVVDKDRIYAIGREVSSEENIILNIERISKANMITDLKNEIFGNEDFKNIYYEMFSISVAVPINVKVEFDDCYNIKEKLDILKKSRRDAVVKPKTKEIIEYTDKIRGEEDFAKYLRKYGKSARVIEPQSLKDKMKHSIELMRERYGIADE